MLTPNQLQTLTLTPLSLTRTAATLGQATKDLGQDDHTKKTKVTDVITGVVRSLLGFDSGQEINVNDPLMEMAAQRAIGSTYRPFEFYVLVAIIYYIINLVMEAVLRHVERRIQVSR